MRGRMDQSFHLSFNCADPFELAVFKALKTLPRGYGKLFFLRMASLVLEDERSTRRIARIMFDFGRDVRPVAVKQLDLKEYKEGDPATMLAYYPPSVEMSIPDKMFRASGREKMRAKLRAMEQMAKDEKPKMRRIRKEDYKAAVEVTQAVKDAKIAEACATGARPIEPTPELPHIETTAPAAAPVAPAAKSNVVPIKRDNNVLKKLCWG